MLRCCTFSSNQGQQATLRLDCICQTSRRHRASSRDLDTLKALGQPMFGSLNNAGQTQQRLRLPLSGLCGAAAASLLFGGLGGVWGLGGLWGWLSAGRGLAARGGGGIVTLTL